MQIQKKQIALIGAGKLGKGYLADLFGRAGYELIFMARNPAQVAQMRAQGYYTVVLEHEDGSGTEQYRVEGFQIWCTEGPEREDCLRPRQCLSYPKRERLSQRRGRPLRR